jgi:hypothetical protein
MKRAVVDISCGCRVTVESKTLLMSFSVELAECALHKHFNDVLRELQYAQKSLDAIAKNAKGEIQRQAIRAAQRLSGRREDFRRLRMSTPEADDEWPSNERRPARGWRRAGALADNPNPWRLRWPATESLLRSAPVRAPWLLKG